MKGRVIGIFSAPGGVGKTTLAASLGWLLRESGKRVLLVDMDPSISLSWLLVKDDFELMNYEDKGKTLTRILHLIFEERRPVDLRDFLVSRPYPSSKDLELDLIMPDLRLTNIMDTLWVSRARREIILRRVLDELDVRRKYDVTIIDTIPFFDRKYSVLVSYAVDKIIIPLRPTIIDVYRTQTMLKELPQATAMEEDELYSRIGLVFNMVRSKKQAEFIDTYVSLLRSKIYSRLKTFSSHIPYYIAFSRVGTEGEQQGDREKVRSTLKGLSEEVSEWVFSQ